MLGPGEQGDRVGVYRQKRAALLYTAQVCRAEHPPVCSGPSGGQERCASRREPLRRLLIAALALSACGFGPLSALGVALGFLGRVRLRSLPYGQYGARWANVAIVVGLLNSSLWASACCWFLGRSSSEDTVVSTALLPLSPNSATRAFEYPDYPEIETLGGEEPASLKDDETQREAPIVPGQPFVTIGASVESLTRTLEEQITLAKRDGRSPMLLLVGEGCRSCDMVERRLRRPELRRVLSKVRLLRIRVDAFESELTSLRMPTDRFPAFVRISEQGLPVDVIGESEWASTASNFAKVLDAFIGGDLDHRIQPWRGGQRSDETPI